MMYRILCLEDSPEVQLVLEKTLSPKCECTLVDSIKQAREKLASCSFDLLILDIGLPDGDGLRFCSELKSSHEFSTIPVFILTANSSLQEKILGFQLGIEDYITKPFEPLELRLRVESRLKKICDQKEVQEVLSVGNLVLDYSRQKVFLHISGRNSDLELSTTEFKILSFLARNKEQVKSREQIIAAVWESGFHLSDRTVDSHVSRIRKKILKSDCLIGAVQNSGYRFYVRQAGKQEKIAA